jgi:hypothetical protein
MRKIHSKQARNYKLGDNQSLSQKMARLRARVQAGGSYTNYRHPEAPKSPKTQKVLSFYSAKRYLRQHLDCDNPHRKRFTVHEIECMWLSLCALMAFFGGNRSLACRATGFPPATYARWIAVGRISTLGADVLGANPEIPFSRQELRPDLSPEAWKRFDQIKGKIKERRERARKSRFEKRTPR